MVRVRLLEQAGKYSSYEKSPERMKPSAYGVSTISPTETKLFVYNFGSKSASGSLSAIPPKGWSVEGIENPVKVDPMGRLELPIRIVPSAEAGAGIVNVRFVGDFGADGQAVASMRISPRTAK